MSDLCERLDVGFDHVDEANLAADEAKDRIETLEAALAAKDAEAWNAAIEAAAEHLIAASAVYKDDPDTWQALNVEAAGILAMQKGESE